MVGLNGLGFGFRGGCRSAIVLSALGSARTTATTPLVFEIPVEVGAAIKRQESFQRLGFTGFENGYCTVEVTGGGGIVALASVVDEHTGDAMTVDALHPYQIQIEREQVNKVIATDFSWTPRNPVVGDTVQFTDLSATSAFSWTWTFGDGETSSEQNPSHVYTAPGSFPVTLTVATSDFGTSFTTKNLTVSTAAPDEGSYILAVVARSPGAESTTWRSDLWIMNPFAISQNITLVVNFEFNNQ